MDQSSLKSYPLVGRLRGIVAGLNPMHLAFVDNALGQLSAEEMERFQRFLSYCRERGADLDYIARSYLTVVDDTLVEQMFFLRHKRYQRSSFAEVADHVYHNKAYMDRYMYGLVVTAFLWPNHIRMARFFRDILPRDKAGAYLEIGPGHGYYMMTAASEGAFDALLGVDISEASIGQTRAMLDHFAPGASRKIELRHCDFLDAKDLAPESFDAVVMGEVLEHVEQPQRFLRRIAELAKPDAFIYVTTCTNAPAIDHIFLWRTPQELEGMIVDSGPSIREALRLPYEGRTLEQAIAQSLAVNVAYRLERA